MKLSKLGALLLSSLIFIGARCSHRPIAPNVDRCFTNHKDQELSCDDKKGKAYHLKYKNEKSDNLICHDSNDHKRLATWCFDRKNISKPRLSRCYTNVVDQELTCQNPEGGDYSIPYKDEASDNYACYYDEDYEWLTKWCARRRK